MKATNIVKHSNIVDREKRSEALGTGKLFLTFLLCLVSLSLSLRSLLHQTEAFFFILNLHPIAPHHTNPETLNIPLTNECADRYITNVISFFFFPCSIYFSPRPQPGLT